MSTAAARIAPEERLVNLVVALMATEHGLTKHAILTSVSGYREQSEAGASKDALEKMFERDKENLRALGVPIETIGDAADPDDLRDARYRVPSAEYELPDDISFSPEEVAVLDLAAGMWGESSMSAQARSGLRKIRGLGLTVDEPVLGYAPRINPRDPAFAPLQRALEQGRRVLFDYHKPGERQPLRRRVEPLALVEYEGRWHVIGFDLDQDAERTFLLSRITSPVKTTRDAVDPARREGAGERALAGLRELAARQSAVIEATPGTEASLRLRRRGTAEGALMRVPFVDVHILADELASYGPEVRVVEPPALRDEVIARLTRAAAHHSERGTGR